MGHADPLAFKKGGGDVRICTIFFADNTHQKVNHSYLYLISDTHKQRRRGRGCGGGELLGVWGGGSWNRGGKMMRIFFCLE